MNGIINAAKDFGWALSICVAIFAVGLVYVKLPDAVGLPLPTSRDVFPMSIEGMKPQDVCREADTVVVSENPRGPYFTAIRGPYKVTYTTGDDKFGFFYESDADYPDVDQRTIDCLISKAVPGVPE